MRPAEGPRRRTTGLRREEVAALAGMSVDYVVRLEQGRSSQPSVQLLGDTPALVLSDLGEVLAQNRAALLLAGDHTSYSGDRRYIAYRWFTDPAARAVTPPEEQERQARQLVADPRAAVGRRGNGPNGTVNGPLPYAAFVRHIAVGRRGVHACPTTAQSIVQMTVPSGCERAASCPIGPDCLPLAR